MRNGLLGRRGEQGRWNMELNGHPIDRATLAELCRESDRREIEHREYLAERAALASEPDDPGVIPHDDSSNALYAVPEPEPEDAFTEFQKDVLAYVFNELRKEWER